MIEPTFVDEENIPMNDYTDDYTDNVDRTPPPIEEETIFTTPLSDISSTSSMQSVELKRQNISDLYRHLEVLDNDPNLASLDRFRLKLQGKAGVQVLKFFNDGEWSNLTDKRTGKWLADTTLKSKLGEENSHLRHT